MENHHYVDFYWKLSASDSDMKCIIPFTPSMPSRCTSIRYQWNVQWDVGSFLIASAVGSCSWYQILRCEPPPIWQHSENSAVILRCDTPLWYSAVTVSIHLTCNTACYWCQLQSSVIIPKQFGIIEQRESIQRFVVRNLQVADSDEPVDLDPATLRQWLIDSTGVHN